MESEIRKIAAFLDIEPSDWTTILDHCTFDYMKAHADMVAPRGGIMWSGGAKTFINKGTNGRWRDTLSAAEVAAYDAKAVKVLGPACAKWLAHGYAK